MNLKMKYTKKILMILITCFCTFLNAEKKQPNPYAQGTERIVLTDIEKASLKAYAENSKTLLEKALSEANGKSLEEANSIYQTAIIRVVAESFEKKYHSELLLRFTLNQALELTIGTPDPENFLQLNRGVLKNIANGDLVTAIYENSIKLALNYYQSDMDAIESGDFVKLPFIDMAMERLLLAQKWMGGISSPQLRLKFLITALEHWYLTVTQRENLDINKVAHLIIGVDQALEDVKKYRNIGKKIRSLRGKILWVLKQADQIYQPESSKNFEGVEGFTVFKNPRYLGEIPFDSDSPSNGICKALGYERGSSKSYGGIQTLTLTVNSDGSPKKASVDRPLTQITCIKYTGNIPPTVKSISEPKYPGSGSFFDYESDINGICKVLGYRGGIPGGKAYRNGYMGHVIQVGSNGQITLDERDYPVNEVFCRQ